MIFVNLKEEYVKYYFDNQIPIKKFGVFLVYNNSSIFIPITSPKEKFSSYSPRISTIHTLYHRDKVIGHLRIDDYIYCGGLIEKHNFTRDSVIADQYTAIKKNEKQIKHKLEVALKNTHKNQLQLQFYSSYMQKQKEKTIFLAKNKLNDIIKIAANFERIELPSDYKTEVFGIHQNEGYEYEILNCMKEAWQYLLDNMFENIDVEFIIKINEIVAKKQALKVGMLRDDKGGFVHGSNYEPPIPAYDKVAKQLSRVQNSIDKTEAAFEFFCYATRNQLFYDGNKRTSLLIVNKILLDNGIGFFLISEEVIETFHILLNKHYNYGHDHNAKNNLKSFLIENCINVLDV